MSLRKSVSLAVVCAIAAVVGTPSAQSGLEPVHADLQTFIAAKTAPWSAVQNFSFGVYSDIHMTENPSYGLTRLQWQRLLGVWRDSRHLFGMIVGDLGYGEAAHINNVLSGPAAVPDAPPVLYQMGNHELDGMGKRPWIDALFPGAVRASSWKVQTATAPGNADQAYYSFDVGPFTHFIVLDGNYVSYDGLDARARQNFGQAQLNWLAADISANATRNILVFVHEPIDQQVNGSTPYYTLVDKGGLIDLLAAHPKQSYIFSGHFHNHRGITRWRGVTSVHVQTGSDPNYGVSVTVNGDQITVAGAGTVTAFDDHPMNQIRSSSAGYTIEVAEENTNCGFTRAAQMFPVPAERGVVPTSGSLMLKAGPMTWYAPTFISEQLVKVTPGMKLSYDIYLTDVVNGKDAVAVQPNWYMKNGMVPPGIVDQNGLSLSRRPSDGTYMMYNEDLPLLGGRATNQWYHREFDLSPLAGHYIDGVYLSSAAVNVNVGTIYVDNIKFTWTQNALPAVALTAPAASVSYVEPAALTLSASATDADGWIRRVDFRANGQLIGSRSAAPFTTSLTLPSGSYDVTAVAVDNLGGQTTSAAVRVVVTAGGASTPQTLLGAAIPSTEIVGNVNYELGMRFFSTVAGQVTGIRFWKVPGETGQHTGRIWSQAGQVVASVVFAGETSSGWQQQLLQTPLSIPANTEYVVSVNTTDRRFAASTYTFTTERVSGDLHAPAGNNGLFNTTAGLVPNTPYASTNYFRDILFVAGSSPAPPPPLPPTGGPSVTLLGTSTPAAELVGSTNYELGMRFFSTVAGQVTGIRFWKVPGETGQHTGRIWSQAGQAVASVVFAGETSSGWQQQLLQTPLSIPANTEYVVSVNTTDRRFAASTYTFTTERVSGDLHAPAGNNGLFNTIAGLVPNTPYASTNYFRDILFVAGSSPVPPPSGGPSVTLLGTLTPAAEIIGSANYELGMRLFSTAPGLITAIRFWKVQGETGSHVGRIWSASGQLLASVTFANETSAGWQEQPLPTPLAVVANVEYLVSVNMSSNRFAATTYAFTSEAISGSLHAPAGNNGLFSYAPGTVPTVVYASTNYFRDVRFVPTQ